MEKKAIGIISAALALNLALFITKLYVGISTGCLAIYCDGINNLADSLSCGVAVFGFAMAARLDEKQSMRAQSLVSFVTALAVALTGAYFAYQGAEKLLYPTLVSFRVNYAVLIAVTAVVKLFMAFMFRRADRGIPSPVFKTMMLDCFMDFGITLCALMSFGLSEKLNFAIDGLVSVLIGVIVAIGAIKTLKEQIVFLIKN
ncbi:MAG: cation transporter [Clostridia bacterium]|nr:cation transporter [Clostridia bacterium]